MTEVGVLINWGHTGTMLSGVGTVAGAFAVAFVGWFGAKQWRKQKIQNQQIDTATEILRLVYEVEDDLAFLVKNMTIPQEVESLKAFGFQHQYSRQRLADLEDEYFFSIVANRASQISQRTYQLRAKSVEARLILGEQARSRLQDFYEHALEMQSAAQLGNESAHTDENAIYFRELLLPTDGSNGELIRKLPKLIGAIEAEFAQHTVAGK
ncbi:hypothetical protein [Aurantiacibacter aquimixticola]|uniref:Uncharacterized protein n=1 Tax=Aurantiacibacter aquimixticola TaxID=1958945 RepID=A0A419RSQ6_9SPHN|nr:hypothetical protein [Aurantiacibacter aquimixticola]RJY08774.1 hypothetical protein D6201_04840 [Aurantiacibacter aquimixticola]